MDQNTFKPPTISPASDRSIMIQFNAEISEYIHQQVHFYSTFLLEFHEDKISNLSPAYNSILIRLKEGVSLWRTIAKLKQLFSENQEIKVTAKKKIKIPVCYELEFAPDLTRVASLTGLSIEQIIHKHTTGKYLIYFLGFSPGFPYIGGMDPNLETPRLESPRTNVPAGAVAIGGKQTGIYPIQSPGGWNIIGRTPLTLFNWSQVKNPALSMGATIEFTSITKQEFLDDQESLF
jgi:inhibitor of KinA